MKKISVLLIAIMLLAPASSYAIEFIDFNVEIFDHSSVGPGTNRTPIPIPEVSIDGYTLLFSTPCDGCRIFHYYPYGCNHFGSSLLPQRRLRVANHQR